MKNRGIALVNVTDLEKRKQLLDFLEKLGYRLTNTVFTREMVQESIFPITVNMKDMTYDFIGNITGAAELSRRGLLISIEEFYEFFDHME